MALQQILQVSVRSTPQCVLLQDVRGVLNAEFPGQLDVVYEGVGGDLFRAALANLSPSGRLLSVGYISVCPLQPCGAAACSGPNYLLDGAGLSA